MYCYDVILLDALASYDQCYSYTSPRKLEAGQQVIVPFGPKNRPRAAMVLGVAQAEKATKSILEVSEAVRLSRFSLDFLNWIQEHYLCPPSQLARLFLPQPLRAQLKRKLTFLREPRSPQEEEALAHYLEEGILPTSGEGDFFRLSYSAKPLLKKKKIWIVAKVDPSILEKELLQLPARQQIKATILENLLAKGKIEKSKSFKMTHLKDWLDRGWIALQEEILYRKATLSDQAITPRRLSQLNGSQEQVLQSILKHPGNHLIHGVSASGKNEIALHLIADCLNKSKRVLYLVPERGFITPLMETLQSHFGEVIGQDHSLMSAGERLDERERIRRGDFSVVVGSWSILFTQLEDVGLILIDEGHDESYYSKQPFFDARALSQELARRHGASLVMLTATPTLEQLRDVAWQRHELPESYDSNSSRKIHLVDMRHELLRGNHSYLSETLKTALEHCLAAGDKALLFYNQLGSYSFVSCRNCGYHVSCPGCGIAMSVSSHGDRMQCRLCGIKRSIPSHCPACGSRYFRYFGGGIAQLQEQLRSAFPQARILRADSESLQKKADWKKLYQQLRAGHFDILLGTQVLAKGHDFLNVQLIGAIAPDLALHKADFRSAERSFQLLYNLSGRTGRGRHGEVYLQTYTPEHYVYQALADQDPKAFYEKERRIRKKDRYPPYRRLLRIEIQGEQQELLESSAKTLKRWLIENHEVDLVGPYSPFHERLRGRWRINLLMRFRERDAELWKFFREWTPRNKLLMQYMVDPPDILF